MNIVVIGGGLIGITSAYFLQSSGHQVTIVERRPGPGEETSFANGALLTPSMSQPWNTPGCWHELLASLVRPDAALQLRLRALPGLVPWGVRFLSNATPAAYKRNTLTNLRLALYSREIMGQLRRQLPLAFAHAQPGALRIFRTSEACDRAMSAAEEELSGLPFRKLTADETADFEPALKPIASQLVGSIHYESDETGDAYQYCLELAAHARNIGVQLRFDTEVTSLQVRSNQITSVLSRNEHIRADGYVIAAGSYSTPLLERVGIHLPVRPAKGYSLTFRQSANATLNTPILDDDFHAAIVPLDGHVRVAGTAEFAGYDLTSRPSRIRNLMRLLVQVLPNGRFDLSEAKQWCGLRAMSSDGVPIIGGTAIGNLYVSTGHGHLGWTMAAGSARLLADLISGTPSGMDAAPFSLRRFS